MKNATIHGEIILKEVLSKLANKETINVRVTTNAKESCIKEFKDDVLHIKLRSIPDKGKANKELIELLKEELGKNYEIIRGLKSREKVVRER